MVLPCWTTEACAGRFEWWVVGRLLERGVGQMAERTSGQMIESVTE